MSNTILVSRHAKGIDLEAQAEQIFAALGISKHEERFSENYPPDDHYFVGFGTNASVVVCDADDEDASTFPYWIMFLAPVPWGNAVDAVQTEPAVVTSLLHQAGILSKLSTG